MPLRLLISGLQIGLASALLGAALCLPHVETEDGLIVPDMTFVAVVLTALIPVAAALAALALFS